MTATPASVGLRAVTREVEPGRDLLATLGAGGFAWVHHGRRLATSGAVTRVTPQQVAGALDAIEADDPVDRPGTGAVAVGALPFDARPSDGELVIPARVVAEVDGRAWVTEIEPVSAVAPVDAPTQPSRFAVVAPQTRARWRAMVDAALAAIQRGDLEKVVLAREVFVEADRPFDVREIAARLISQQPGCFVYACDGLVGASPELLVRRIGDEVESLPVAGTAVADGDEAALRALAASVKDHREHRYVVDAIVGRLRDECHVLHAADLPEVAVFGHVAHLSTRVQGRVGASAPSALDLAQMLSPTPAVGGTPRDAALETIRALEGFDRGRYAGPVGWVDARGNGEWAIALRGAEVDGRWARLVAGAGIVEGSDADAEWAETQAKFEPMLRALVRP
jgi:menaquinone-specific isochorismate synthase